MLPTITKKSMFLFLLGFLNPFWYVRKIKNAIGGFLNKCGARLKARLQAAYNAVAAFLAHPRTHKVAKCMAFVSVVAAVIIAAGFFVTTLAIAAYVGIGVAAFIYAVVVAGFAATWLTAPDDSPAFDWKNPGDSFKVYWERQKNEIKTAGATASGWLAAQAASLALGGTVGPIAGIGVALYIAAKFVSFPILLALVVTSSLIIALSIVGFIPGGMLVGGIILVVMLPCTYFACKQIGALICGKSKTEASAGENKKDGSQPSRLGIARDHIDNAGTNVKAAAERAGDAAKNAQARIASGINRGVYKIPSREAIVTGVSGAKNNLTAAVSQAATELWERASYFISPTDRVTPVPIYPNDSDSNNGVVQNAGNNSGDVTVSLQAPSGDTSDKREQAPFGEQVTTGNNTATDPSGFGNPFCSAEFVAAGNADSGNKTNESEVQVTSFAPISSSTPPPAFFLDGAELKEKVMDQFCNLMLGLQDKSAAVSTLGASMGTTVGQKTREVMSGVPTGAIVQNVKGCGEKASQLTASAREAVKQAKSVRFMGSALHTGMDNCADNSRRLFGFGVDTLKKARNVF